MLHDEAIWKAVSRDKSASRGKKLRFSNLCASNSDCSSNIPRSPRGSCQDRPSGPPPQRRRPPRLLPPPLAGRRGRSFEGSSPPSQPQVGGVLGRHWHAWKLCGADEWTVVVLQQGYSIPFHHLPHVSLVPRELLSCALRSDWVIALQEEVFKMLQKGAVEPVDQPCPGFYSRLFLIEKVTGGWRPVINLSKLDGFVTVTKFHMETVASVLGSIRQGDWIFSIDLKDASFQIPVHPESRPYLRFCLGRRVFQFWALCFSLSTAPHVFPRVFALVSDWAHTEGHMSTQLPGRLAGRCRDLLLQQRDLLLQLC